MAENTIYYGPPGTGKTYSMQRKIEEYIDFGISDRDIENAYMMRSEDWILIALVIMQNNDPMTAPDILRKIGTLSLGYSGMPSDVLESHSIEDSTMGLIRRLPRIFFEVCGKWYVDRLKILEYDSNFITNYMKNTKIEKRYDFVTFHQSFVYEDFVEGIRPIIDPTTKTLGYEVQKGIFKRICETAIKNPHKKYALFIDEINRGNISEIFGELISLIELDKRLGQYCELTAVLPYSKTAFGVPSNLNIIGTMNSADKSIATIDMALRRRFDFISIPCAYEKLEKSISIRGIDPHNIGGIDVSKLLKVLNKRIELLLDNNHIIGHAYFIKVSTFEDIKGVLSRKIIPLLEEYFFDDLQKIQMIFCDIDEDGKLVKDAIYIHEDLEPDKLLTFVGEYTIETKKVYSIDRSFCEDAVKKIYDGVII
jgi:hypothetical protein